MKAFVLLSLLIGALTVQGQNNLPKITAQNQTGSYGVQVCLDITTTDNDNDTVVIWWDKGILGTFTSNNQTVMFATGSVCATLARGKYAVGDNFFTVFASDGKDTVTKLCNIVVRDYPYQVHPTFFNKFNTFTINVMGDVNEPWGNYIGLTFQSKIYDLDMKLVLTDTHRVFTFTPTVPGKYLLLTTYKTSTPDTYTSKDTLQTDIGTGTFTVENNKLYVYPNPATNTLYLQNLPQHTVTMLVYDITGKQTEMTINNNTADISQLSDGLYQVVLYGKEGEVLAQQRFIKSR